VGDQFDSGIELISIWMSECSFKDFRLNRSIQEGEQQEDSEGDLLDVEHNGEVYFDDNGREAIVRLTVTVKPEAQPSFVATVSYAGFYRAGTEPKVPLPVFAWNNGMAYLVPFVREKLAALTQASDYPTVYLQPFNLAALSQGNQSAPQQLETVGAPKTP
jgi:preprotein translocase subunit SecB